MVLKKGKRAFRVKRCRPGLLTMRYLFGQQEGEKIPIGPAFLLGPIHHLLVDAAGVGQVQSPEQRLQLPIGEFWNLHR